MGERIAQERRRACGTRNRRDKTVAAARHIGHIACARSLLPKRLAQRRDMKAKAALIDHKVRPHSCDQLLLADHFGRAFTGTVRMPQTRLANLTRPPALSHT